MKAILYGVLVAIALALFGCLPRSEQPMSGDRERAIQAAAALGRAFVESDFETFADLIDSDFAWNGMTKSELISFAMDSRAERISMKLLDSTLSALQLVPDVWNVVGVFTVESTYSTWPAPQVEKITFEWQMRDRDSGFKLFAMASDWPL